MPPQILPMDYINRRKVSGFVVLMLSLTAFNFVQGTALTQIWNLSLTSWPILSISNVFATIGIVISIGFIRNWF